MDNQITMTLNITQVVFDCGYCYIKGDNNFGLEMFVVSSLHNDKDINVGDFITFRGKLEMCPEGNPFINPHHHMKKR